MTEGAPVPAHAEGGDVAAEADGVAITDDLVFGIGCFSIVPKPVADETGADQFRDPDKWKDAIETGLGALTSVTALQVVISGLSQRISSELDILNDFPQYDIDMSIGPEAFSFVGFTITIPKRMHAALLRGAMPGELKSERFNVLVVYGFNGPVTYISALEEPKFGESSRYVVLVREFLRSEFERVEAASALTLQVVGPSPFHADFAIASLANGEKPPSYEWKRTDFGYDEVRFYYDASRHSATQAFQALIKELLDSLSMYYYQVRARNRRRRRTRIIDGLTEILINTHTRGGVRGWWKKTFKSGGVARGLLLSAIRTKQLDIEERAELEEDLASSAEVKVPRIREMCLQEAKESDVDHLAMSQEIAQTLEGGRLSQYEVMLVSASTLLGGAAGAIAALIAS